MVAIRLLWRQQSKHVQEKTQIETMIPKISNHFFHQDSPVIQTVHLLSPLGWGMGWGHPGHSLASSCALTKMLPWHVRQV